MLDNMAEEGSVRSVQDTPVKTSRLQEGATCCPWAESMTAQIDRLSGEMTALHSQLDKLVARRRSAWCQKVSFEAVVAMGSNFSHPLFFSSLAVSRLRAASLLVLYVNLQLLVCLCPQHARCSFKHKVSRCPREAVC